MTTMAQNVIAAGKENSDMLIDSIENGPFKFKKEITILGVNGALDQKHQQKLADLSPEEKIRYNYDIKATNIILLGIPVNIYTFINDFQTAKEIWYWVKELMEGTKLALQERESKLYDKFDRFTSKPGELIHSYYWRYAKLIIDMNIIKMTMKPIQVNTKFVNHSSVRVESVCHSY
ncbi:hypothetical protein Tco_0910744 [Tanacetum coccineum]|uniref:Integrase, catalytic region, zinc finger, CCHC-type, peptidase aspartic, catalytic n=1 Tax=Tanacetum coccineum TaxID=301880 RepID=A0ABQ5CUR2_9ASTR